MTVRLYPGAFRRRAIETQVDHLLTVKTIYNAPVHPLLAKPKAVAFDLDETIGSFSDLYIIWSTICKELQNQTTFNALLDLYPEFLRPGILHIFEFLKLKIANGYCLPIFIYTNNQCDDPSWVEIIVSYLESRVSNASVKLFARLICAFKINNVRVEPNRTSHEKTYKDFIRCSMLKRTDLCFVDDASHEKMKHKRVYYIQPPPYFHTLTTTELLDRFTRSELRASLKSPSSLRLFDFPSRPQINTREFAKREQEISNKMMYYMREYFFVSMRRCVTKKHCGQIGRFSRKKRHM